MDHKVSKIILYIVGVLILVGIAAWYFYGYIFTGRGELLTVAINSCSSIEPTFMEADEGATIVFVNKDSKDHTLVLAGTQFSVPAGDKKPIVAKLAYGAGTYAYDCDETVNAGQLQIKAALPSSLAKSDLTFKEIYDTLADDAKSCVKDVFAGDFDKVYNRSEGFSVSIDQLIKMNDCFKPQP
jgi:hypothetical protein